MLPTLQLGPLALQVPGLLLLIGLWVGVGLAERAGERRGLSADSINGLVLTMLLAGVVGARLAYVARFAPLYWQDPLSILALNANTLSPAEGVILGLLAGWVYGQRRQLPLGPTLDSLAPGLACLGLALGLAHLASGDAFGAPADVPWSIELWGARRHPSQVYEILLAAGILLVVWRMQARWPVAGVAFLTMLALTAAARLLLEGFRGDSQIIWGSLRQAQLISLLVLELALAGLYLVSQRERHPTSDEPAARPAADPA